MLSLKNIVKDYLSGDNAVRALDGVSLDFREHEFVSILGPSGCGKTTLLNIIGGLDQYTSGDLIINGVSTKKYKDADWDTYRNHSIGFVFQSYNLIPHQTVLANVELALTLSGVSKKERRRRAVRALKQVGLGDQLKKHPSQMSGGQMQRVAIARALVNDPDILLADEPTGALDTHTSVQIMEILRKISKRKLIIMVTHNPDLAREYSSRIIRVTDGRVVADSAPYRRGSTSSIRTVARTVPQKAVLAQAPAQKKKKKRSMSFFTALGLSLNNLMTKKARTFMTSFAGSIGIIGIALILSVSTGVNAYINAVQRDTLASYPIQLKAESVDMSALITSLMGAAAGNAENRHELDRVYESAVIGEMMNSLNTAESTKNDLNAFKKYLENNEAFREYLAAKQYTYDFDWAVLTKDVDDTVVKSDVADLMMALMGGSSTMNPSQNSMMSASPMASFDVWEEMLEGNNGETVSNIIKSEYDVIYGDWPQNYNEIMLVVDKNNEISDLALYALGLRTKTEIVDAFMAATKGEVLPTANGSWSYEEICSMTFRLFLKTECYQKQTDGTYTDMSETESGLDYLYSNPTLGIPLKVVGIIRPSENATSAILSGNLVYTAELTRTVIEKTQKSTLIADQIANPTIDVLTGLPFKTDEHKNITDAQKKEAVLAYIEKLPKTEKATLFTKFASVPTKAATEEFVTQAMAGMNEQQISAMLTQAFATQLNTTPEAAAEYVSAMSPEDRQKYATLILTEQFRVQYAVNQETKFSAMSVDQIVAQMYDTLGKLTDENFVTLYDDYLPKQYSESNYEENLKLLGDVDLDSPDGINLFASTFEDKDEIAALIKEYNKTVDEAQEITYTDYVALLMSSVTTIVDAISYVLIAFVAISLVVSSIMIGIITYISVLERTKEIGILRAIGASKKDIRRVFNAETLIVGFVAGMIGILATLGLNVIINIILFQLTGIPNLKASLPVVGAVLLVLISMFLTFIAGLFPSGFAAKRNPVEALRSE